MEEQKRDNSAELLFQSNLREDVVSSSGTGTEERSTFDVRPALVSSADRGVAPISKSPKTGDFRETVMTPDLPEPLAVT